MKFSQPFHLRNSSMTSLAINKSTVVGSNSIHPSPTFLKFLSVLLIVFFGFSISANADVVSQRKAGFKTNAASMKAIASAIGDGDYQTVINQAKTISSWAHKIPGYFPEGSRFGDTKARAEIWANFDDFTALSKANETRANRLVKAAKSGDLGAMMAGLINLLSSCKACHRSYKD